jgi:hypothetical protein
MIALSLVQQSFKCSGCVARARQMFGTRSIFLVALMSANTSRTIGSVQFSSTSFTVGMASLLARNNHLRQGFLRGGPEGSVAGAGPAE